MSNFELSRGVSPTHTPAVLFLIAAMGSGNWAAEELKPYSTSHVQSTVSIVRSELSYATADIGDDFAAQMAAVYTELLANQTTLGADFEAVWDANARELYEA
jgi:hypothetical protein